MDPVSALGLAASVIAVIQLTGALIKPATSSLGPSENDEKELNRLLTTMTGFQVAYNNLEHYLRSNPATAEALVTAIQQPIQDCKTILSELKLRLTTMTFVRKHIIGRKWDKGFKRLVQRLDDARQLFDVILQGDQSERLIKISQFLAQKFEDIGEIKAGVQNAGQRISEIHLTVQNNQQRIETQAAQHQSELRSIMDDYQNKVENQFSQLEKKEQRKLKDEILRWLTIADPKPNQISAYASHKPGTGDWFTKGQNYRNWLSEPNSFFWLNGKAGCGKTVLSSTIIENTGSHCDENEGCVMAYFYFSFTDSAKQQYANMLRSLLAQIASQVDITPDCLASLHRTYKLSTPPTEALKSAIQILVEEMPFLYVYMIVDAVDEIPNTEGREEACKLLEELSRGPKSHVLMTSRREHDITEYTLECISITDISIQNPEVDHDIQLYIREQLKEDKKLKKWSAVHPEIEEALSRQADGMFRWAACQLDSLKKCLSPNAVRKALKSLPKTLDETYERILLAVDEEYRDIAVEALRWLCFSNEVLTIELLAEAAVFSATVEGPSEESPLQVTFDRDDLIQDPLDIVSILSGLVVCRPPDDRSDNSDDDVDDSGNDEDLHSQHEIDKRKSKILLSHFSVKEYLVSGRLKSRVDRFAIDERCAHEILGTKCLYFILYCQEFLEYSISKGYHPTFRSPFFYYASESWIYHAKTVEYESKLSYLIISLFEPEQPLKGLFSRNYETLEDDQEYGARTPLYYAAIWGLYWPCKTLIENGADVNMQGGLFGNPLQAASWVGRENIVQLLLHHGANVNMQGGFYRNPLQAALALSHENIFQLLLHNGADANIQGGRKGSPLRSAISYGRESAFQLLLDHGAEISIQIGYYDEVLDRYYEKVVRRLRPWSEINAEIPVILLEHGAVMSKFHGGIEAEEALARKDFKRFVAIQMEAHKEIQMRQKQSQSQSQRHKK